MEEHENDDGAEEESETSSLLDGQATSLTAARHCEDSSLLENTSKLSAADSLDMSITLDNDSLAYESTGLSCSDGGTAMSSASKAHIKSLDKSQSFSAEGND